MNYVSHASTSLSKDRPERNNICFEVAYIAMVAGGIEQCTRVEWGVISMEGLLLLPQLSTSFLKTYSLKFALGAYTE